MTRPHDDDSTLRLDLVDLVDPDPTAYVERYVPPVPPRQQPDPCSCGLARDHRNPVTGEPRPCTDETARIGLPGPGRPPVPPSDGAR